MRVSSNTSIREGNAITRLNNRRHFFKVNLVHDAVTGWNHIYVFKGGFSPLNKVETVFVTTVFNGTVLFKSIRIKTCRFNGQRVVNNQLSRNDWVYFGRVAAHISNGITQASQVNQSGLAKNVVAHDTGWVPRKVKILFAFN